jgi:hypothetical protein
MDRNISGTFPADLDTHFLMVVTVHLTFRNFPGESPLTTKKKKSGPCNRVFSTIAISANETRLLQLTGLISTVIKLLPS